MAKVLISTCQRCLTGGVEVFYTHRYGWICEICRDWARDRASDKFKSE